MNKLVGIVIAMAAICCVLLYGSTTVFAQSQDTEAGCKTEDATEKCVDDVNDSADVDDSGDEASTVTHSNTTPEPAAFEGLRLSSPTNELSPEATNPGTEPVSAEDKTVPSSENMIPANDTDVSTKPVPTEPTAMLSSESSTEVEGKSTLHQFYQIARGQAGSFPLDADSRTAEALAEGYAYEKINQVCGPAELYEGVFSGWLGETKCQSQDNPLAMHGISWICYATATVTCKPKLAN